VFKVRRDATKPEIKAAVELMFEVKVDEVNVVNSAGKLKRSVSARASVRFQEGVRAPRPRQSIDFAGAEA
jgi:large subunit ribosomal protein L23